MTEKENNQIVKGYTNTAYKNDDGKSGQFPTESDLKIKFDSDKHESISLNNMDQKMNRKQINEESNPPKPHNLNSVPNYNDNDDDDDDDEEINENFKNETLFGKFIIAVRANLSAISKIKLFRVIALAACLIGYCVYFGFAMKNNNPFDIPSNISSTTVLSDHIFSNNKGLALFILTIFVFLMVIWDNIVVKNLNRLTNTFGSFNKSPICNNRFAKYYRWATIIAILICCIIYLAFNLKVYYNLLSILGIAVFVLIASFMSTHPSHIQWQTLICGILAQFILGVFVMRFEFGYMLFKFLGDQVSYFLNYTDYGSRLVFGDLYTDHFFAFKVMPVVIFFSSIVNFLYYIGAIQYVILKLAWLVNKFMGTSPTESINATANIFLGQSEAPLLIKPFLPKMTPSELFAVMVGGFATVSGSVLAAYIGFGVPANQLLTASIMAAPTCLAISKVMFPETRFTKANWETIKNFPKGDANNILEAFSIGATAVVGPIGAIVSNLIAFTAIFQFVDSIVAWFFSFLGLVDFGFSSVLQYLFWPFAFAMGTAAEDCLAIGKLIGIKVILNELIAYRSLGATIEFRKSMLSNGTTELYRNGTLSIPKEITMIWNDRSISIAAFALCGFANVASIGIQIGGLSALAPSRSKVFARYAFKAMLAGNLASFMNACISGLLFEKL